MLTKPAEPPSCNLKHRRTSSPPPTLLTLNSPRSQVPTPPNRSLHRNQNTHTTTHPFTKQTQPNHGRQAPRATTARSAAIPLHRRRLLGHIQARVDVQHCARQPELVPGPPAAAAVHEHRAGAVARADAGAAAGAHDPAGWAAAEGLSSFLRPFF